MAATVDAIIIFSSMKYTIVTSLTFSIKEMNQVFSIGCTAWIRLLFKNTLSFLILIF